MSVWSTDFKGCKYAVGIDLGTTNSCVALWRMDRQKAKVFKNLEGAKTFPSVVAFCGTRDWTPAAGELVAAARAKGDAAVGGAMTQTVSDIKRVIGLDFEDDRVAEERRFRPYEIVAAPEFQHQGVEGASKLQVKLTMGPTAAPVQCDPPVGDGGGGGSGGGGGGGDGDAGELPVTPAAYDRNKEGYFYPEEISARILQHAKRLAEDAVGDKVRAAVVTIPAYFEHRQRKATRAAARLAGFEKVRLLTEPTAGAMAYGLFVAGRKTVCVFDLGGGTFDSSLLCIDEGTVEVLATHGDTRVGGSDIDKLLVEHVLREVQGRRRRIRSERTNSSPPGGGESVADVARSLDTLALRRECEAAKVALSTQDSVAVKVFRRRRRPGSATAVAGGETKTPPPAGLVEECQVELTRAQLDALCAPLFDRCMRSVDDCLHEAGKAAGEVDEVVLVGGCTRMPELRKRLHDKFQRELCLGVDPDKAVAMGAAIQAAILVGSDQELLKDMLTMDVIPRSVGIETATGGYEVLIPRNSKIPCSFRKKFTTVVDQQPNLRIVIYEGEHPVARDNQLLTEMRVVIPRDRRGPAGKEVEMGLALDENGIFRFSCSEQELSAAEKAAQDRAFYIGCVALGILIVVYVYIKMNFHIPTVPTVTTPFPEYNGEGVFGTSGEASSGAIAAVDVDAAAGAAAVASAEQGVPPPPDEL